MLAAIALLAAACFSDGSSPDESRYPPAHTCPAVDFGGTWDVTLTSPDLVFECCPAVYYYPTCSAVWRLVQDGCEVSVPPTTAYCGYSYETWPCGETLACGLRAGQVYEDGVLRLDGGGTGILPSTRRFNVTVELVDSMLSGETLTVGGCSQSVGGVYCGPRYEWTVTAATRQPPTPW